MKNDEIENLNEIYVQEIVKQFLEQDRQNYLMYNNAGLSDLEIYDIITSPSIKDLYIFDDME